MGDAWNMLTLEQLQVLSNEEIVQQVNERLAPGGVPGLTSMAQPGDVIAAQFYMGELDRRENRRVNAQRDRLDTKRRRIDLGLELLIVVLIGLELILGVLAGRQQSKYNAQELKAFAAMQQVLSTLQISSQATADTLGHLESATQSIKTATQGQLAVSYDPSVMVRFDIGHKLDVMNNGRTNITLWGSVIEGQRPYFLKVPSVLPPNAGYEFDGGESLYAQMLARFEKEGPVSVGYDVYVKNELGTKFVANCTLTFINDSFGQRIVTKLNAIARRDWQGK